MAGPRRLFSVIDSVVRVTVWQLLYI